MTSPFNSNTAIQANPNFKKYLQFSLFQSESAANISKNQYKKKYYTFYILLHSNIYNILQQPNNKNKTEVIYGIHTRTHISIQVNAHHSGDYRKCGTHARVSSPTLAHGNSKNDKDKDEVGESKKRIVNTVKRRVNMEENTTTRNKEASNGLSIVRAHHPPGGATPRSSA